MFPTQEDRPDRQTNVLAWELSWTKDLEQCFAPSRRITKRPLDVIPANLIQGHESDSYLLSIDKQAQETCDLQTDLTREVVKARPQFENAWRAMPKPRRDALILAGISHTCTAPYIGDERGLCPEITLNGLSARDGEAFLDILRHFVPHDVTSPVKITEPICVSHPVLSRFLALTHKEKERLGCRMFVCYRELSRAYFMTLAVWSIFLLFYGKKDRYDVAKNIRFEEALKPIMKKALGKNTYKEIMQFSKDARKEHARACWQCGSSQSTTVQLHACSRCRAIGRDIFHCSKACQVKDWKEGIPKPHRQICGKTSLALDA